MVASARAGKVLLRQCQEKPCGQAGQKSSMCKGPGAGRARLFKVQGGRCVEGVSWVGGGGQRPISSFVLRAKGRD
jgi:hypothetical protein